MMLMSLLTALMGVMASSARLLFLDSRCVLFLNGMDNVNFTRVRESQSGTCCWVYLVVCRLQ
jgi:hypothetical protein